LSHKLYIVQFEVTNKARTYALAYLLRIEMTQREDATLTHTCGLEIRVVDVVGVRLVANALLFNFDPIYIRDQEPDNLSDANDKTLSRSYHWRLIKRAASPFKPVQSPRHNKMYGSVRRHYVS
jgi:hypothetical protein